MTKSCRQDTRHSGGYAARFHFQDGSSRLYGDSAGYIFVWHSEKAMCEAVGLVLDGHGATVLGGVTRVTCEQVSAGDTAATVATLSAGGTVAVVTSPASPSVAVASADVVKLLEENKKLRAILAYHGFRVP